MDGQRSYYSAALTALRFVEERQPTGRRFGKDADAAWRSFKGHLTAADRIDLLLRDADVQWRSAFGARSVYALPAVAEDESFGAQWESLRTRAAEELWREIAKKPPPGDPSEAILRCAAAWDIRLQPVDVGRVSASTKLLLAGPSAVASAMAHFSKVAGLSWSDQVLCIATPYGHRQLALLSGALLNADGPARLASAERASELPAANRVLVSDDAAPEDAAAARKRKG